MSEYKLVIMGEGGVGKSAITIQFIQNHFVEEYDPTIEDSYRKCATVDDETCLFDILDTASDSYYDHYGFADGYIRSCQAVVLVYSITERATFDALPQYYERILRVKDDDFFPVVVLGNKVDLEHERQVSYEDGQEMATSFGPFCSFFESSALTRVNIEEAFQQSVRNIRAFDNVPGYQVANRLLPWLKSFYVDVDGVSPPKPTVFIPSAGPMLRSLETALYHDDVHKDMTIKCLDGTVTVHRFMMAVKHRKLVSSAQLNGSMYEVEVDESVDAMSLLVEWLYLGTAMTLTYGDVVSSGLLSVAQRVDDKQLQRVCTELVKRGEEAEEKRREEMRVRDEFNHVEFEYRHVRFITPSEARDAMALMDQPVSMEPPVTSQESIDAMTAPIITTHETSVLEAVWRQMKYTDVELVVKNKASIRLHRAVLAAASPHFTALFDPRYNWAGDSVNMGSVTHELLKAMVEFIYTGAGTVVTPKTAYGLLWLSDMYALDERLRACCEHVLAANIDEDSVCRAQLLTTAIYLGADQLKSVLNHVIAYDKPISDADAFAKKIAQQANIPVEHIPETVTASIVAKNQEYVRVRHAVLARARGAIGLNAHFGKPKVKWYQTSRWMTYKPSAHVRTRKWYLLWLGKR